MQGQTGCKIYAPGVECAFTRKPILEPSFLYGGFPCRELRHKFLMAQESDAEALTKKSLPAGFEVVDLPGHFFDMVGYRTPDNIVFLADCLSSREILDKYQLGFIYDVEAYLNTLAKVNQMQAKLFIPAHAAVTDSIAELAQYNMNKVYEAAEHVLDLCAFPVNFEVILQKVFADYKLAMNFEQYVIIGSTVRSYLGWLKDNGKLRAAFDNNMLL